MNVPYGASNLSYAQSNVTGRDVTLTLCVCMSVQFWKNIRGAKRGWKEIVGMFQTDSFEIDTMCF